jgi:ankyrin repeat protein
MDINKADYGTVVKFGNIELLIEKMKLEKHNIDEVVNVVDNNGVSLLEKSLISRKFEIAKYLLDNNAEINIVSNEGCNELHYLASNINFGGAVQIANRLIDMNVNLDLKEKKYNNSSLWCLCQEVLKRRTEEGISLIIKCLKKNPNVKSLNNLGYSVENLINERGTHEMKKAMEEIIYE